MTQTTPGRTVMDQIRRGAKPFTAIVVLIATGLLVGGYIAVKEGLHFPSFFPGGTSYYRLNADFRTAQAVDPGQGQAVTIAGVRVGVISNVRLSNGLALVSMNIQKRYAPVYRDATLLLRPKTQLKDMTVELDKGTRAAGAVPSGGTLPVSQSAPDVNLDQVLASLDANTRAYLQELIGTAGTALKGRGTQLSAALRRFDPTTRDLELINRGLAERSQSIGRVIHNLSILTAALGSRDKDLASLVRSSNAALSAFAQQNADVSSAVAKLPTALRSTRDSLGKLAKTGALAGRALGGLRPTARALGPAERASRSLFASTTPVLKNQIRPFTRVAQPLARQLDPAAKRLAAASPDLTSSFAVLNSFLNGLAYDPPGSQQGFLFYLDWAMHNFNSAVSTSDGAGPLLSGELLFYPPNLTAVCASAGTNPALQVVISQLNLPCSTPTGSTAALSQRTLSGAARSGAARFNSTARGR